MSISGTGKVGTSLTLTPPVWDNDFTTTTYQWQRDGANISGATQTTYAVTATDVGKALTVKATGTRAGYDPGTSVSGPITGVLGDAPNATTEVSINGANNKVGTTWTLTAPTWDTTGVATAYQWYRDATPITGATSGSYKLASLDVGASVTVRATATKAGYQPGTSTSNAVVVAPLDPLIASALPTITGVAKAKETLTANPGTWQISSGVNYTYQWFVNGEAVARETSSKYVVRTRDAGLPVSVRVTANAANWGPGTASSAALSVAKLSSTMTATAAKTKITQRQRAVLTVKVSLLDFGVSLGQVQVKDGSKTIASTGAPDGEERRADHSAQEAEGGQAQADHHLPGQRLDLVIVGQGDDQGRQGQIVAVDAALPHHQPGGVGGESAGSFTSTTSSALETAHSAGQRRSAAIPHR